MAWAQVRAAGGGRVNTSGPQDPRLLPGPATLAGALRAPLGLPTSLRPFSRQPLPQASQALSDRVCVHAPPASL